MLHDPLDFVAEVPDAGEVGRIVIRGATLFSGYWPDGGGGPGADGWFVTGDIGFLDDAGELHLVDRAAEVVKVSGFTVYPREVEEVLATHPYVAEVAVIGMPGVDGQQQIVAVIVPRQGKHPTPDDLAEFVAELLPAFKRPAVYHLVARRCPEPRSGGWIEPRCSAVTRGRPDCRCPGSRPLGDADRGTEDADGDRAAVRAGRWSGGTDVAPEVAGDLAELGARLPGTGSREDRGEQDTDEDLF